MAAPYSRYLEEKTNIGTATRTFTVPSGVTWDIGMLEVKCVTDASVANRLAVVQIKDVSGDLLFAALIGPAHAASLTKNYFYAAGLLNDAAFVDTTNLSRTLPKGLVLPTGATINISFTAGVAGDNFEARLVVSEQPLNI